MNSTPEGIGLVCGVCYGARAKGAFIRSVEVRQALPIEDDLHHFAFGPVVSTALLPLCDVCWIEDACILVLEDDGERRWADWRSPK